MPNIHPKFIIRFFIVFICIWIGYKILPNYYAMWNSRFDYSINTTMTFLSSNGLNKGYSKIKYNFKTWEITTFSGIFQEPKIENISKNNLSFEEIMKMRKKGIPITSEGYITKDKKYLIFLGNKINRNYGIPFEYGISTLNIMELATHKWKQVDIPKNGKIIYDLTYIIDVSE